MPRFLKFVSEKAPFTWFRFYPMFFFMGVRIRLLNEGRTCRVEIPLKWRIQNMHGSLFGGALAAVSDPFPALWLQRQIPGSMVWSKSQSIQFLKPAHSAAHFSIMIETAELEKVRSELKRVGKTFWTYSFPICDSAGETVAEVQNTVFIRL